MSTTDPPIRPPGKGEEFESMVNELKLKLSSEISDKFNDEPRPFNKQVKIASYAIDELAYCKVLLKLAKSNPDYFKKIIDGE